MENSTTIDKAQDRRAFTAIPDIPRKSWKNHDNYALRSGLLRSHDSFREISDYLVDKSRGADALSIGNLIFLFLRWKQAMKNHEAYEERKLYPYLSGKFGISFSDMENQHDKLGVLERRVIAAWGGGDHDRDRDTTASLFAEHDQVLKDHLIAEEDRVIPLILSLTTDEYELNC
jgi:hypothetical protein